MKRGVLILHGFSGGPYELEPFLTFLHERTNWIIETPTFCGHGEELSMHGYKAEHWLMDAEIAYRKLAKKVDEVVVIGFSMGGVIALYIAKRYSVKKLVLLSAAVKYMGPAQLMKDLRIMAREAVNGHLKDNELFQRYEYQLRHVPLSATVEFTRVVKKVEPYIGFIEVPTFIVQGEKDSVVPSITAQFLYDQLKANEKHIFLSANGEHHICFSDDCEEWFFQVLDFLQAP
ncbi:alpha/beta fold hydrolase [Solibacillus sp. CAU 1738]|uniref:alpha/beta hydrolase n=1 Tax=Solibacillus sp. CAU 1738 TaxID=3140363 RepID=UPI003260120A